MTGITFFGGYHAMDTWMANYGAYGWIFMLVGGLIFIAVEILIVYYVHRNALRNKIPYPELWLLLGLFLNVFGLIVYLLARRNYRNYRRISPSETENS